MPSDLVERAVIDAVTHDNALLKFISPNDTGATGSHQCGYYLPKNAWTAFTPHPPVRGHNAEHRVRIVWHDDRETESRIKWYGTGTRREYRLTRLGRNFPFLTPDNIGNLLVLIRTGETSFRGYVFDRPEEIEDIQAALGLELNDGWGLYPRAPSLDRENDCIERRFADFVRTLGDFPNAATFSEVTRDSILHCMRSFPSRTSDDQLMLLVRMEYILFRMAERRLCQPQICRRFRSVDQFLAVAATIMNRRKSRAGRSLENHFGYLLQKAKIPFDACPDVDGRPDILIPGKKQYTDYNWPDDRLFAVGLKTTCKDRWRQVLNEARRVRRKHIVTLQQGISAEQLTEMRDSGVSLVVPQELHAMYPPVASMEVLTVGQFIDRVRRALGIHDA